MSEASYEPSLNARSAERHALPATSGARSSSYDAMVAGCASGSVGYSCAPGSAPPDQADPGLVCSVPTIENGVDAYCCFTNTATPPAASTCAPDPCVVACQPDSARNPSYGFSCTKSENPGVDYSNVNCSAGMSGIDAHGVAATLYCCTHR